MKKLIPLLGASLLVASPATAQDDVTIIAEADLPTAVVYHGDLDLDGKAGVSAMKQRIASAARQLCISGNREQLAEMVAQKACYRTAKADGFQQLEDFQLASAAGNAAAASTSITIRVR